MCGRLSDADLEKAYAVSDVFALPSEGEGFGLVFAEAMAYGLPIVCVNAGAAPEIVVDEVSGLVAEPRNTGDLSAKLLRLASDKELRVRLGREARRRFEDHYSAEKYRARVMEAVNSVNRFGC